MVGGASRDSRRWPGAPETVADADAFETNPWPSVNILPSAERVQRGVALWPEYHLWRAFVPTDENATSYGSTRYHCAFAVSKVSEK